MIESDEHSVRPTPVRSLHTRLFDTVIVDRKRRQTPGGFDPGSHTVAFVRK